MNQTDYCAEVHAAARAYIERRWDILHLPLGSKSPNARDWGVANLVTATNVDSVLNGTPKNVGMLLGGLTDVDLDCQEAVRAASEILPATRLRHGRPAKPNSHYWFDCGAAGTADRPIGPRPPRRARRLDSGAIAAALKPDARGGEIERIENMQLGLTMQGSVIWLGPSANTGGAKMSNNESANKELVSSDERERLREKISVGEMLRFLNIPAEDCGYVRCALNDCGGTMWVFDDDFDCSRCGVAGDVFTLVREILKCSEDDAEEVVGWAADPRSAGSGFGGWLSCLAFESCAMELRKLEGNLDTLGRGLRLSRPDEEWLFFDRFSALVSDFFQVELGRFMGEGVQADGRSGSRAGGRLDQPDVGHGSCDPR